MTKWLNPDATIADVGEGMQAYYDEKLKVWVFPGEDPEEKAKPIGPPPTALGAPKEERSEPAEPPTNDPLAAMMAPPKRAPSALLRQPAVRARSYPGMPPMAGGGGSGPAAAPPPKFAVFMPAPVQESAHEENESVEEAQADS